ncbi:unnamed protein product [Prunus armeniaca]|uniref:Uncharacterized protein n=1 Tax=Prunus armeniaca TaxID=36596 RepID=A0A6J5Y6N1_PRUAR|nr:unnamed protein product [Prunus armeniaca]
MASIYHYATSLIIFLSLIGPNLSALVEQQPLVLKYHNGALLKGNITVNLIGTAASPRSKRPSSSTSSSPSAPGGPRPAPRRPGGKRRRSTRAAPRTSWSEGKSSTRPTLWESPSATNTWWPSRAKSTRSKQ